MTLFLVLGAAMGATASDDDCARVDALILCDGSRAEGGRGEQVADPRTMRPDATLGALDGRVVTPQTRRLSQGAVEPEISPFDHQPPHGGGSQYLGNNTCRYWGTRYADGDHAGNASYGVDNSMGMYARATANQPFLPGTNDSAAFARGGMVIGLPEGWPQPASITVTFPWHTRGVLDVNSDPEASAQAEHETIMMVFRGSELAAQDTVVSRSINTGFGPRTENVADDGTRGLTVTSPGNMTYFGLGVNWAAASATGASVTFTNARGTSLFFGQGLHVWLDHQDWQFNLPSGWTITSCE